MGSESGPSVNPDMILQQQTEGQWRTMVASYGAKGGGQQHGGQAASPCYDHQDDANNHIDADGSSVRLAGFQQRAAVG